MYYFYVCTYISMHVVMLVNPFFAVYCLTHVPVKRFKYPVMLVAQLLRGLGLYLKAMCTVCVCVSENSSLAYFDWIINEQIIIIHL